MNTTAVQDRKTAKLKTPSELGSNAIKDISAALRALLADTFALYLKTKNFHWHMNGSHFRDYHLLLDEQSEQIFAMTDDIAERARKIGGTTLRSIGNISRLQRLLDINPDLHLETLIARTQATASPEIEVAGAELRRLKAELHLLTALCDLGGR